LRRIKKHKDGKNHCYWALVESYRTPRGSRQRIVCYIGDVKKKAAQRIQWAIERCESYQPDFFSDEELPDYLDIETQKVRTERQRDFGGVWLGLKLYELLGFDGFFSERFPHCRETVDWPTVIKMLVIGRFYAPCSELHLAEHVYEHSAFEDLLGVPASAMHENRLYRCLDRLLPHKDELQRYLKDRLGKLFDLQYELILYDVTSTYFEGAYTTSELAQRGYSRDGRSECKQVCIALAVTKEGLAFGYEVFAGNVHDSRTVEEVVTKMEALYGKSDRIWVWDRGMTSAKTIEFLKQGGRRYIIGTPKSLLTQVRQLY
jgi:transposase